MISPRLLSVSSQARVASFWAKSKLRVLTASEAVKTRNLDFAQKLATRACELTDNKRGEIIDTLARVYAEKHDYVNAVKYEKMAVEAAPDEMAAELKKTLAD